MEVTKPGLLAVCLCILIRTSALASLDLKPSWVSSANNLRPNSSFLAALGDVPLESSVILLGPVSKLVDPAFAQDKKMQYADLVRSHSMRSQYNLLRPEEEKAHQEQLSSFSKTAMEEVGHFHLDGKIKKMKVSAEETVENDPILSGLRRPVELAVAAIFIYRGRQVNLPITKSIGLTAKTDVPGQRAELRISSPIVNGTAGFIGHAPTIRDPHNPLPDDVNMRDERYRFSLSRGVPVLDVTTHVSYGTTTRTVTTTLSKQLSQNLSCALDSSRYLQFSRPGVSNGDETLRLSYGISF